MHYQKNEDFFDNGGKVILDIGGQNHVIQAYDYTHGDKFRSYPEVDRFRDAGQFSQNLRNTARGLRDCGVFRLASTTFIFSSHNAMLDENKTYPENGTSELFRVLEEELVVSGITSSKNEDENLDDAANEESQCVNNPVLAEDAESEIPEEAEIPIALLLVDKSTDNIELADSSKKKPRKRTARKKPAAPPEEQGNEAAAVLDIPDVAYVPPANGKNTSSDFRVASTASRSTFILKKEKESAERLGELFQRALSAKEPFVFGNVGGHEFAVGSNLKIFEQFQDLPQTKKLNPFIFKLETNNKGYEYALNMAFQMAKNYDGVNIIDRNNAQKPVIVIANRELVEAARQWEPMSVVVYAR